jgi:hypothetical protein
MKPRQVLGKGRLKEWSRTLSLAGGVLMVVYLLMANLTPFGESVAYTQADKELSPLGPKSRVQNVGRVSLQSSDFSYFTTSMPFAFDQAHVSFKMKNPDPSQVVTLGYRDQVDWHYTSTTVSAPLIDQLGWPHVGDGPALYQKKPDYSSTAQFLNSPPSNQLIGIFDYDATALKQPTVTLPGYKPASTDTVIDIPLRGKTTMYAYLSGEPFKMAITKRDLNWYPDPDTVDVSVYKDGSKVFEATSDDDGDTKGDGKHGPPQTVNIVAPGPGLPEAGVYKIVIDAPSDVVVTKVETNLHKIAFEGPLYPVQNKEVYGGVSTSTMPTTLYTNAEVLTADTDHSAPQMITYGNNSTQLQKSQKPVQFDTGQAASTITFPKSDVIVNGFGYFAFSQDQFFAPTPYHLLQITNEGDLAPVDYVITNYHPPKELGDGWVQLEEDVDLSGAVPYKDNLSWIISAPGLAVNKSTIQIKDIQMTLTKKGWFTK